MSELHTMAVYRVETKSGYGPYRGSDVLSRSSEWNDFFNPVQHPTPHYDVELRKHDSLWDYADNYIFGFNSLEQLYEWFHADKILMLMKRNGFAISKYLLPKDYVIVGDKQIIFKKIKGQLDKHIKIYTLRYRRNGFGSS